MPVENKNQVSERILSPSENMEGISGAINKKLPYVYNDITTFFTMMVGIYFPSVTGETTEAHIHHTIFMILVENLSNELHLLY